MPALSNLSSNRDLTLWAQLQPDARTITNTSGVWIGGSGLAKLRFDSFAPQIQNPVNSPTYKTGKRSKLPGARGRQGASGTLLKPFIPSGIAGTVPDDDCILQTIMGKAPTLNGSNVTYTLADTIKFLMLAQFNNTPGLVSPTHTYLLGAIPTTVKFILNQNFLNYEIQYTAIGAGDSVSFGSYTGSDAVLKGGLTTYPVEPTSFIQNGDIIAGFGAGAGVSINGTALSEMRGNVEINLTLGTEGISNALNDAYTVGFVGGARKASVSRIQCIDSDGAVLNALKVASRLKTLQHMVFQLGSFAGSTVTFDLKNVQIGDMGWQEDGAGLDVTFAESDASASDINSTDEFSIIVS